MTEKKDRDRVIAETTRKIQTACYRLSFMLTPDREKAERCFNAPLFAKSIERHALNTNTAATANT